MRHIDKTLLELRRYIAASEDRDQLEEIDALLDVAIVELRRKLAAKLREERQSK